MQSPKSRGWRRSAGFETPGQIVLDSAGAEAKDNAVAQFFVREWALSRQRSLCGNAENGLAIAILACPVVGGFRLRRRQSYVSINGDGHRTCFPGKGRKQTPKSGKLGEARMLLSHSFSSSGAKYNLNEKQMRILFEATHLLAGSIGSSAADGRQTRRDGNPPALISGYCQAIE
jgi:hypothetical protein